MSQPAQLPATTQERPATEDEVKLANAISRVALGESIRRAAAATGLSPSKVWRHATAHLGRGRTPGGMPDREQIAHMLADTFRELVSQMNEALMDGTLEPKQVAYATGVIGDKLEKIAGWRLAEVKAGEDWLATIASRLSPDQTLELKVSTPPKPITAQVIPDKP